MPNNNDYGVNQKWALEMQPLAIEHHYSKVWPQAEVVELDKRIDDLAKMIDIGGADKMLKFPDGHLIFLGQRFRRYDNWHEENYDDFTLRTKGHYGHPCELLKAQSALKNNGFTAGFYAYGHANPKDTGFSRFRIVDFPKLLQGLASNLILFTQHKNPGGTEFIAIHFLDITRDYIIYSYPGKQGSLI